MNFSVADKASMYLYEVISLTHRVVLLQCALCVLRKLPIDLLCEVLFHIR